MNRKCRKMMTLTGHFRFRKWFLLLSVLLVYLVILAVISPDRSFPEAAGNHPIFEAENVTEYKIKNNLKLILVWTRLQVG